MSLPLYRKLLIRLVAFALASASGIMAQGDGNVIINSDPQGALVELSGDYNISGVTPVKFDRPLSGQYKVIVSRDGFEKQKSTMFFSETQQSELNIRLVPKTRVKSLMRSLIIPGWGQRYYGNGTKAALFALGTAASAIGYYYVKKDYDDKFEIYSQRKTAREEADSWSDIERLDRELYYAQKDADDAEKKVNIAMGIAIGVYAFNLLDSFLLFPETSRFTEYKALTFKPGTDGDKVSLTLAVEF